VAAARQAIILFCLIPGLYVANLQAADNAFGFIEMRSQSPLQQLRCGPVHHVPWVLPPGTYTLSVRHNWKNMWLYQSGVYRIDAEIHEIITRLRVGLGEGLEITGELPVRFVSGGILDGLIEGFHRSFNISNAGRGSFPRGDFAFDIHNGLGESGWSHAGAEQTGWNLGNVTLGLSLDIGKVASIRHRLVMTLGLKLPTGTRTEFFGGQSVDFGLSLSTGADTGPIHWYLSSSVSYYGDEEMIGIMLHQRHVSGLVGLEYMRDQSAHAWTAQILVESGVARDFYYFSDATYELMFGYRRRLSPGVSMEIGILENVLAFDNSPDIGLHTALTCNL